MTSTVKNMAGKFKINFFSETPNLAIQFVILMKIAKKTKFVTLMVNAYKLVRKCTQNAKKTSVVITMKKHACQNVKVIWNVVKA
mgnify:FL=1